MEVRLFGRSGLRVSEICLGTMTFGKAWGFGASVEESRAIFEAYCEAGGNFIDTANNYTAGESEQIVGELIARDRDRFVVSTKYSLSTNLDDPNAGGNHRKNMVRALEGSLRRLGTSHVDLYWVHAWDALTPVDEVMRALDDLVRSGKVLHVGVSDTPAWVISRAHLLAELRGWSPFTGIQLEYSLIERTGERELLPMASALGMGVVAWAPLGAGILTGKYVRNGDEVSVEDSLRGEQNSEQITVHSIEIAEDVTAVARELDCGPAEVALAWIRQRQPGVIPAVGARTVGQFRESLGALRLELPSAAMDRLDAISRVELGFPHEFLERPQIRRAVFGNRGVPLGGYR